MTFWRSHTILGFLVGFSDNNLCCLVFSSMCGRPVYYLRIAFSHSHTLNTHTFAVRPPSLHGDEALSFVLPSFQHLFAALPFPFPLHLFECLCCFTCISPSPTPHLPPPPRPHPVSSFCYQPCFHNNCDLAVMRNHF